MQKIAAPVVLVILLVNVIILAPDFDAGYSGTGEYLLGSFWPTWILSAVIAAQLPISYTPFANDFARYVSTQRWTDRQILGGSGAGMFVGCWIVLAFGAYTSTLFPADATAYGNGLVEISPTWFVLPLLVVALLGSFAQGGLALYGTGLDTSSIIPRLSRVPATLVISAVSLLFVFLGTFVWDAIDTVSAFLLLLLVRVVPWMMVTLIGYHYAGGRYWAADLQIFNAGGRGGAYWYSGGVNWRAAVAYVAGVVAGLLFVNTSIFVGPLANSLGGVDWSLLTSGLAAGIAYVVALAVSPETCHPAPHETSLASPVPVDYYGARTVLAAPAEGVAPDAPAPAAPAVD
jgi:purine-cytosine permease-like protein